MPTSYRIVFVEPNEALVPAILPVEALTLPPPLHVFKDGAVHLHVPDVHCTRSVQYNYCISTGCTGLIQYNKMYLMYRIGAVPLHAPDQRNRQTHAHQGNALPPDVST